MSKINKVVLLKVVFIGRHAHGPTDVCRDDHYLGLAENNISPVSSLYRILAGFNNLSLFMCSGASIGISQ